MSSFSCLQSSCLLLLFGCGFAALRPLRETLRPFRVVPGCSRAAVPNVYSGAAWAWVPLCLPPAGSAWATALKATSQIEGTGLLGAVERKNEFQAGKARFAREFHSLGDQSEVMGLVAVARPLVQRLAILAGRNVSQESFHGMRLVVHNLSCPHGLCQNSAAPLLMRLLPLCARPNRAQQTQKS